MEDNEIYSEMENSNSWDRRYFELESELEDRE